MKRKKFLGSYIIFCRNDQVRLAPDAVLVLESWLVEHFNEPCVHPSLKQRFFFTTIIHICLINAFADGQIHPLSKRRSWCGPRGSQCGRYKCFAPICGEDLLQHNTLSTRVWLTLLLPQINTWLSNTRIRIWRPTLQALTDPGDLHVAARPPSCAGPPDQAGGGWERGWRPQ